jgi:HSP20 family molecular chaperone IbpA
MISRQFVRDLRPFFRMFDEPFTRSPALWGASNGRSPFDHPLLNLRSGLRPAVDVTDRGKSYVVEAELPGVKKENVEVHIGDNGRSITIEGKVFSRTSQSPPTAETDTKGSSTSGPAAEGMLLGSISSSHCLH